MIDPLQPPDSHHLEAAEGWLELNNPVEATAELEKITPQMREHLDVLAVRFGIYAAAKKWEDAARISKTISEMRPDSPFGFIHLAYALHELKRTKEAQEVLLPVVDKFPGEYLIRYNLACYTCRLGNLKEAKDWLEKAIELAGGNEVKMMALNDPDLERLRKVIEEI